MKKILLFLLVLQSTLSFSQFFEGFENTTGPDASPSTNWTLDSGNWAVFDNGIGTAVRWTTNNTSYSGTNCAYANRENNLGAGLTSEDYLATPLITIPANGQLRFYSRTFTNANQGTIYQVKIAPSTGSQTNLSDYTLLQQYTENTLTNLFFNLYGENIIDLSSYAGQQVYIAFVKVYTQPTLAIGGDRWLLDDVLVQSAPSCEKPISATVTALATFAALSWTQPSNPDTSIATDWQVLAVPCGSPIPTETTSGWIESANNNFTYTNLNPDTCYCFYVRAVCSTTENSLWSSQVCATTQQLPPACGGIFTDSGGVNGSYQNNENITTIICPDNPTDFVSVTFTSFSTENCCDHLSIYDGTSATAPLIGTYQGSTSPGTIESSSPGGCLTFVWTSDTSVSGNGWIANINCAIADSIILKAFIDANNNGVRDSDELSFIHGDFLYDINNSGNLTNAYSPSGSYTITDTNPNNLYDFSYQVKPEYQAFFNSGSTFFNDINIETGSGTQFLYFPITITQTYDDVSIAIVPLNTPSPGFYYQNFIVFKNVGVAPASGTITFVKPTPVTTVTTTQTGTIANATGFTYNYTDLLPNETRSINVTMTVPTNPTVNLNDLLTATAFISTSGDIDLTNNYASNTQIVVGSFDPNDKMESHGGKIVYNEFTSNDYLYYTIRFENTGTAAAENIRIEDVLDSKLDETSIRMISASHDYLLDRIGSNLAWKFNNIHLPVSVPDTQIGKGYLTFKIKPKPGYAIGDIIPNTANIYFDFNPAITTNTFNTEFVAALANTTFEETDFVMHPNPATNLVTINLKNNAETINSIVIYDVLGKKVKSINSISSSNLNVDVSSLSKGIYIVKLKTDSSLELIKKLIIK